MTGFAAHSHSDSNRREARAAASRASDGFILESMPAEFGVGTSAWSLDDRLRWLARARVLVASRVEDLARVVSDEVGKPTWEAATSDVFTLLNAMRWLERRAKRILRPSGLGGGGLLSLGVRAERRREPLGVVAIIATWNYPLQLLGIQVVQALVAGNRVVVKPSEGAPRSQRLLLLALREAGTPAGMLEWVDSAREAGPRLLSSMRFDHIVFTGSTRVGREVASVAAESLTPTTLELSGRDSAFVLDDANAALAARSIWHAVTLNAGQTCMAPRRALVDRKVYERFVSELAPLAAGAGPRRLREESEAARAFGLAEGCVRNGARSLSGVMEAPVGGVMRPLAIVDCRAGDALVDGDHFGPVLAVVRVDGEEEALRIHRRCDQHLSASIFTDDRRRADRLGARLGASIVSLNDAVVPAGHPAVSLGGSGRSGWGVSRGEEGLRAMTRPVCMTRTRRWLRLPTEAPSAASSARLVRWMARLFGGAGGARRAEIGAESSSVMRGTAREADRSREPLHHG